MFFLIAALAVAAAAQQPFSVSIGEERLAGAALAASGKLYTWGDKLREWSVPSLESTVLASGPFGEGGCVTDLDGDGSPEIAAVLGTGLGRLVRMQAPDWKPEAIDTEIEMHDCIEATLFGRRGILMIQRGMQVRFYQRGAAGGWTSRDIYSIYTPSYQGGLALGDVDGDGRTDIYCGNYWIRSPERFELPWRLFAINTWTEEQDSATFRLVARSGTLIAAQAHMPQARLGLFRKPKEPTRQWPVTLLARDAGLAHVHGLAEWDGKLVAGEQNGAASRLLLIDPVRDTVRVLARGSPVVAIVAVDRGRFAAVAAGSVTLWTQVLRK